MCKVPGKEQVLYGQIKSTSDEFPIYNQELKDEEDGNNRAFAGKSFSIILAHLVYVLLT